MTNKWEFTESGGLRFWREDIDGNTIEQVILNPTSNGQGEIGFTTDDGATKRGSVEPGADSNKGLGQ